ncbi:MAG: family 10 glycosylhydrolase [Provencibacterium sp.]|nr:family 10 glycosylhydrolase [Provencibacterium sp.]
MRLFRSLSVFLSLSFLAAALCLPASAAQEERWRAVWVSSVYNLDYPLTASADAGKLRSEADAILDGCSEMGMNAVILQVRPSADALYPSDLFPWSAYLTGDQQTAPEEGLDPLLYWLEGAHARGMQLHAWINPYRITTRREEEFASLAPQHPARLHPDWVVRYTDGNYYFDPGVPEVRRLVADGVREILERYPVDGIHLDDYFYPGTDFEDAATFARYGAGFGSRDNWRRQNVNLLVKELSEIVRAAKGTVQYGISPMGIWANEASLPEGSQTLGGETYFSHFADSKKWVENGWVDYICPQIYWNIGHKSADYETLVRWWSGITEGTGVKLYIGMADYQAGAESPESPWYGIGEIQKQLSLNETLAQGEAHFRYQLIAANAELRDYYRQRSLKGS